jgi:Methyltransferase domain
MKNRRKSTMARFGDKAVIVRNDSLSAALLIPDDSVDFVYVDARHDYCGVMEDLLAWWPKLKKGGLMAGHDYFTAEEYSEHLGAYRKEGDDWTLCVNGTRHTGAVKGAVLDFARNVNVSVDRVSSTGVVKHAFPSWYFPPKS